MENVAVMYFILVFLVGPIIAARAIVVTVKTPEKLEKVLIHFLNYAVIAILGWLLSHWNRQLEKLEPHEPSMWIALVAFTCLAVLTGGFALANYYFGVRTIKDTFSPTKHGQLKTWVTGVLYTFLLSNVYFLWRYGETLLLK